MDISINDLSAMTQKRVRQIQEKFFQDAEISMTNKQVIERAVLEYHDRHKHVKIISSGKRAKKG